MSQRIIVVDDDPVVRFLATEYLGHHGHTVETLEDGKHCLEKLREHAPDVLVLDMLMPDMTGHEILKRLRADPRTAHVPVIMLSADKTLATQDEDSARADCYLQKPFHAQDMLDAIERVKRKSDVVAVD